MKNNLIKKIVIVGGGSSGWLSAAYLSNNFPHFKITIIDKEISTPVGVGEATLLNFKTFLKGTISACKSSITLSNVIIERCCHFVSPVVCPFGVGKAQQPSS